MIVQDALVRVMANRTTVIVAHRLSTVRDADDIVLVHHVKIVEQGPHPELITDPEGLHSQLISLQAGMGESEETHVMVPEKVDPSFETNAALGISGSKRSSMTISACRGSFGGGSGRYSFSLSSGALPTAIPIHGDGQEGTAEDETGYQQVEKSHKVPLTRLAYLNKPELPVIVLGTIGTAVRGLLNPVIGVLVSSATKILYEPAQQLRKDSRFLGVIGPHAWACTTDPMRDLVSQEPVLFNDTIGANIADCRAGAVSQDEINAAAKASNVHHFISGFPNGYDTNVGEIGVQLSGGQKQRIAVARAILKGPKILLLLDEATSALDAESERVVREALDNVMVNRTTVVVAHRLSKIKGVDAVAVLKNGTIVEKGRHESADEDYRWSIRIVVLHSR
ncbi:hypothetical protein ACLOJK_010981 [Asimina triloba]